MTTPQFLVDSRRLLETERGQTGVRVRAKHEGEYGLYDIDQLDRASLIRWLRSADGENHLAENMVLLLLGHARLNVHDEGRVETTGANAD